MSEEKTPHEIACESIDRLRQEITQLRAENERFMDENARLKEIHAVDQNSISIIEAERDQLKTALRECVEALETCDIASGDGWSEKTYDSNKVNAALTKAKEVLK